ncbi:MAG: SagB/ThcOx family dehydrogenase [Candidatus Sumerlaeaceae bacterium]
MIKLPNPKLRGEMSVEEALHRRRSIREFTTDALTLENISQLLWAAQGVTNPEGFRTAPSAGATYPLETYLVVGHVMGLPPAVYHYDPSRHCLRQHCGGDRRAVLAVACLGQEWVREAPASIVLAAVLERTTKRYGKRGIQYVHMEIGHAAQNVYLQTTALGLGTVIVGAFDDPMVGKCLELAPSEIPLAVLPIGKPANAR